MYVLNGMLTFFKVNDQLRWNICIPVHLVTLKCSNKDIYTVQIMQDLLFLFSAICRFQANPRTIYGYIWVVNGFPYQMTCPAGTQFSQKKCACVHPYDVNTDQ